MDRRGLPAVISIEIASEQLEEMRAHVHSCLPEEACGLLAGKEGVVQQVIPVENAAHSAVRFRMDPCQQLAAFSDLEAQGLDLLGIFHSHPAGPEVPSATDLAEATYPVIYLIWSGAGGVWKARAFWIEENRVSDVKLCTAGAR